MQIISGSLLEISGNFLCLALHINFLIVAFC